MGEVESDIRSLRDVGADVARAVFTAGRRYEVFHSLADFRVFQDQAKRSLELIEPVLRKHQLKLAIEKSQRSYEEGTRAACGKHWQRMGRRAG